MVHDLAALLPEARVHTPSLRVDLGTPETRDRLLVYFFTAIGLNARISDLVRGGKPLAILLVLTLSYIVIQNIVGMSGATLVGLPADVGVLAGSTSLIGGHGTAIAWAPDFGAKGLPNALEIGIASATLGLVVASLIGGPIAKYLISRYNLKGEGDEALVGVAYDDEQTEKLNHLNFMAVILVLHVAIIIGWIVNDALGQMGFKLPLFVWAWLLTGLLLTVQERAETKRRRPAVAGLRLFLSVVLLRRSQDLFLLFALSSNLSSEEMRSCRELSCS